MAEKKNPPAAFIDVHNHYLPPGYHDAVLAAFDGPPDGIPRLPQWSPETALEMMDRQGIATAMLSVSSPGVHFGDDQAACRLARSANEFAARLMGDHPSRFGVFASLPMPDLDGALQEIEYAHDTLKLDGFVMLTNAGGTYLGDERFAPVFDELDRRRAVVFIHPTSPACWEKTALGYPRPMIEFMFDSTRAAVDLIMSGALDRHPNLRIIVPHAGGTLPFLARRIAAVSDLFLAERRPQNGVATGLKRLYYDLAASVGSNALSPLMEMADSSRILFGSDAPFTPETVVSRQISELRSSPLISPSDFRRIERGNGEALFPRLVA